MKKFSLIVASTVLVLGACSSKKENKFDQVGKEELRMNGNNVEVVNTKSLEQSLKLERVKKETAERQALVWKDDYEAAKNELRQARIALGLPSERTPCNPCKPGQITPTSTINEELEHMRRAKKKAKRQEAKEDAEEDAAAAPEAKEE